MWTYACSSPCLATAHPAACLVQTGCNVEGFSTALTLAGNGQTVELSMARDGVVGREEDAFDGDTATVTATITATSQCAADEACLAGAAGQRILKARGYGGCHLDA